MYNPAQNSQYDVKNVPSGDGRLGMAVNGEVPSVPITTLAGISSLSDLLPEMPLPTPLPNSLGSKSLLFHPRVVEEANNLLKLRDERLIPLLANSLLQTSSEHIELKENYAEVEQQAPEQTPKSPPELLKAILQRNPNVFKGSPEQGQKGSFSQQKQMNSQSQLSQAPQQQSSQQILQQLQQQLYQSSETQKQQQLQSDLMMQQHQSSSIMHSQSSHQIMQQSQPSMQMQQSHSHLLQSNMQHSLQHSPSGSNLDSAQQNNPMTVSQSQSSVQQRLPAFQQPSVVQKKQQTMSLMKQQQQSLGEKSQQGGSKSLQDVHQSMMPQSPVHKRTSSQNLTPVPKSPKSQHQSSQFQSSHQQQQQNQRSVIQHGNNEQLMHQQQMQQQLSFQRQQSQQQNPMLINVDPITSGTGNYALPSNVMNPPSYGGSVEFLSIPYSTSSMPLNLMDSSNIMSENVGNMMSSRFIEDPMSLGNSSYHQNYSPSTSHNITQIIHHPAMSSVAGPSREQHSPYGSYELSIPSNSGNSYVYHPGLIQNAQQSPLLTSIPTPAPTPSPTSLSSPTRYIPRSSVITSDSMQQNGMYSLPIVDKYLVGGNLDLNMVESPLMVPEINPPMMMQSSDIERQFQEDSNIMKIPMMSNTPHLQLGEQMQISEQHLNASMEESCNMHLGSEQDLVCYSEHLLNDGNMNVTMNASQSNILMDDSQASVSSMLQSDISMMTPPMSSSIQHSDMNVIQGLENNFDLPEHVTPLLDEKEPDNIFDKLKCSRVPVIKLPRLDVNMATTSNQQMQYMGGMPNGSYMQQQQTNLQQQPPQQQQHEQTMPKKPFIFPDSDSEEEKKTKPTRYFRNREKERELQRQKEKDERNRLKANDPQEYNVSLGERMKRRKRLSKMPEFQDSSDEDNKPKTRRIERKLVPVLSKLSVDELMETNTYQKFNRSLDKIFEASEDVEISLDMDFDGEDDDIAPETLIPKYQLMDLCAEAAKLKILGCMESIPTERLTRLLSILERNIRYGAKVSPLADPDDDECERKLWMELAMERVMRAVDAGLISLYIFTSKNMQKKVYLEDVIDTVVLFTKFQLYNTVYPTFDSTYRIQKKEILSILKKKKPQQKEVKEKCLTILYTKLVEMVSMFSELVNIQKLTDNTILHLSTMGVAPFFVQNVSELQFSAMKLVSSMFAKYEKHRKLLLDDILASMARLPSSKHSLRSYKLSPTESIQMLTALILQMMQCIVVLPANIALKSTTEWNYCTTNRIKMTQITASNFLHVFLMKCSSKAEECDFRPLFENFVQDLLTTVNKPEWPIAELMLSVLGKLLVANFVNKNLEMTLRVASLDYLGVVAARLRKDAVTSNLKLSTIDTIIQDIRGEELKDDYGTLMEEVPPIKDDEERIGFLQRVLLDYLAIKSHDDPSMAHARHFYICQWYQDILNEANASGQKSKDGEKKKNARKRYKDTDSSDDSENDLANKKLNPAVEKCENMKNFFLSKINPNDYAPKRSFHTDIQHMYIDYESAELVTRYLASKRPFSQSFQAYLKHIIEVLTESSVLIRTKAMKCLTMIVEVDPVILNLREMQLGVTHSLLDHSTSVREAAVDLVGKFILNQPGIIDKYYDLLSARILDTGVSVRKRVIKILRDVCMEYPDYPKIPEICVKMIRRVNDEEGIRKLVIEVFQNMWFTPLKDNETDALKQKVLNITDVVSVCKDTGLEWFEQLIVTLFKPKQDKDDSTKIITEPPKAFIAACKQIVDCLVDNVISLDGRGGNAPQRLVACVTTLYIFAKIRPQLLVEHAITLQPYLALKCQNPGDYQIISYVARTLEIVVPMLEHASEMFLSQLEEDSMKLIFQHDQTVILSCLSCLASVVNNVTHNFALIRDCFLRYYEPLKNMKARLEEANDQSEMIKNSIYRGEFRRSLYIIGLILRFFDFNSESIQVDILSKSICKDVFDVLSYFMFDEDPESSLFALKAVGNVCIRHYDYMMLPQLKNHYLHVLQTPDVSIQMKVQVLNNIMTYLQEEEKRMIKEDEAWSRLSKRENLKEMGDVSSGMASTIIQHYLKQILETFLHPNINVRQATLRVVQLVLNQGLVHPVQIVPYLICMSTDNEKSISMSADKQLQEIEKKYPGFIHMRAQSGIKLSYNLHRLIQPKGVVIRGFKLDITEVPIALNGYLYSVLRTKQQKRALVISMLKQFEESAKTTLSQMLYLADNVAYFPYQLIDEPLFIIHQINLMISVTGTNLLQSFKEGLLPDPTKENSELTDSVFDEDDDDDEDVLLGRLPEDTTILQECMTASQGCLMLLVLKQHLKTLYGFTDSKIASYSPSESAKVYDKPLSRKNNSHFSPKVAVQKLTNESPPSGLDDSAKRELIREYVEFKQLIISLDREDDEEGDSVRSSLVSTPVSLRNSSKQSSIVATPSSITSSTSGLSYAVSYKSESPSVMHSYTSSQTQSAPMKLKLSIVKTPALVTTPESSKSSNHGSSSSHSHRSHKSKKSDKHRKHHHHKKKKKYKSDDDSDNADSDPDFLI